MKLLPCPFCGKTYKGRYITYVDRAASFECPSCGAEGPYPDYKKNKPGKSQKYYDRLTIEAWNKRKQ